MSGKAGMSAATRRARLRELSTRFRDPIHYQTLAYLYNLTYRQIARDVETLYKRGRVGKNFAGFVWSEGASKLTTNATATSESAAR